MMVSIISQDKLKKKKKKWGDREKLNLEDLSEIKSNTD